MAYELTMHLDKNDKAENMLFRFIDKELTGDKLN